MSVPREPRERSWWAPLTDEIREWMPIIGTVLGFLLLVAAIQLIGIAMEWLERLGAAPR